MHLFYRNFHSSKMRVDEILLCFLLGTIFAALTPIEAAGEFGCPSNCHCSTGFIEVKCPGMESFPVFNFSGSVRTLDVSRGYITEIDSNSLKAYENLQRLDVRHNDIKSVFPGVFSEMETLRELYIDGNPWSCDMSTLHVLQMELTALVDKNSHLYDFDGGRIKCADPPDMKGMKPLHMINSTVRVYHVRTGRKADSHPDSSGGLIALALFLVVLLLAVICGIVWLYRDNLKHWIMEYWKPKQQSKSYQEKIIEAGKADNRKTLIDGMQKRRRMSKGISAADANTSTSSDDDNDEQFTRAKHLKDKMKTKRRQSRGFAQRQNSSDKDCSSQGEERVPTATAGPTDYLKDKMGKQRRPSCAIAFGDCSSQGDISSEGEGSGPPIGAAQTEYLKDKMGKQRRQSCGIAFGDCSSQGDISSEGEGSGPPIGAAQTEYLKDKMGKQRRQSCGIVVGDCSSEGDISSGEEGSGPPKGAAQTEYLRDKMSKPRPPSYGIVLGDCSSEGKGHGLPKRADPTEYLKDKMSRERRQSCEVAVEDSSSEEEFLDLP